MVSKTHFWKNNRIRIAVTALLALILILLLTLFLRDFWWPDKNGPTSEGLLVPKDLAERFELNREGILKYVRQDIQDADYKGILRGAHGALWAGEANPWDRLLLAAAALEDEEVETRIVPSDSPKLVYYRDSEWVTLRLDTQDGEEVASSEPPPDAVRISELEKERPELFHKIVPVFILTEAGGKTRRVEGKAENVCEWVHHPVVVECIEDEDGIEYVLRVGKEETISAGSLEGVERAELVLTWRFEKNERTWTRELFDQANEAKDIPGHAQPRAGDRYAVVVATGPLVSEVHKTRRKMLKLDRYTPLESQLEQDLVMLGTTYFVNSDKHTRGLEAETGTDVEWKSPRIIIAASESPAKEVSQSARKDAALDADRLHSLDVLADEVEATGKQSRRLQTARGMANDQIETQVLYEATQIPVVSATTVLSRFKSSLPNSPERRVDQIKQEAQRLLAEAPYGTRTELIAGANGSSDKKEDIKLVLERDGDALKLRGLKENIDAEKGPLWEHFTWDDDASVSLGKDVSGAAGLADMMLARKVKDPNYQLRFRVHRPMEELSVVHGAKLIYRVEHEGVGHALRLLVLMEDGVPRGLWITRELNTKGWTPLKSAGVSRIGEIIGRWPEVISITPAGPRLENYVADTAVELDEKRVPLEVSIGGRKRTVEGVWVSVPQPQHDFVEAENGGKWYPAVLVRKDGLLRTKNDTYRVHYIGTSDSKNEWLPPSRIRPLEPMAMKVDNKWEWVNVLKKKESEYLVRGIAQQDSEAKWVKAKLLSPVHDAPVIPAEVESGNSWRAANVLEIKDDKAHVRYLGTDNGKPEWIASDRIRLLIMKDRPKAEALLLPNPGLPLVLAWKQGETEMVLKAVTPTVKGVLVDERIGLPVAGAEISRGKEKDRLKQLRNEWTVRSAADGSFHMPIVPVTVHYNDPPEGWRHPTILVPEKRLIALLVADTAAMGSTIDDGSKNRKEPPRRIDLARKWIGRLSDVLDLEYTRLGLAAYSAPKGYSGTFGEPKLVREEIQNTEHVERVLDNLDDFKLQGRAPLTAAINKLAEAIEKAGSAENATVVLISSGENACTSRSAVDAYRKNGLSIPVHVLGVGVTPNSDNDDRLRRLASISGGRYWRINSTADVDNAFRTFGGEGGDQVRLHIKSDCYLDKVATIPIGELGAGLQRIKLQHPCCLCNDEGKKMLTIRKENIEDLHKAKGLSPKAQHMIEAKVKDGRWKVLIPSRRTNIGPVTAYGWFEIDDKSGRIVGRTEDGLHGSSAAGSGNWPPFQPPDIDPKSLVSKAHAPMVAWHEGITAYTIGSVKAAFDWRNSPAFGGSPEEFSRYVQANALAYVVDVWGGQRDDYFWSGVCLNFTLQSHALKLPSTDCHRLWFKDLCGRMGDKIKSEIKNALKAGAPVSVSDIRDALESEFGNEMKSILSDAGGRTTKEVLKEMEDIIQELADASEEAEAKWDEAMNQVCDELTNTFFPSLE